MKIQVITSIAPSHPVEGQQQRAAASWIGKGYEYITINEPSEAIELPQGAKRMTGRNSSSIYNRPYAFLDDLLGACTADVAILTNSDIELLGDLNPYVEAAHERVTIANRMDHNGDPSQGQTYVHGFDLFIVHRRFFPLIPASLFVLGQTWWDYFIPYVLQTKGVPVKIAPHGLIGHHRHKQQYNTASWARMTDHFKFITGLRSSSPQHLTNQIHRHITHHGR